MPDLSASFVIDSDHYMIITIDARFFRSVGVPTYGISPMRQTPVLLHDHNECLRETIFLEGIEFYKALLDKMANVDPEPIVPAG